MASINGETFYNTPTTIGSYTKDKAGNVIELGLGTDFYNENMALQNKVAPLLSNPSKRDITGSSIADFYNGKISFEQLTNAINGSPTFNPNIGPQINYGNGPQSLTPAQTTALNSGQGIGAVANMNAPATAPTSSQVTKNDIQNGASQTYIVKSGDNLSKIAAQFGVPISSISGYSSGDPNKIGVGEVLSINSGGLNNVSTSPVPVSTITPSTTINFSNPSTAPVGVATAVGAQTVNGINQTLANQVGPVESTSNALTQRISDLLNQTGGQGQALATAEQANGVNDLKTQLQNISGEINNITAQKNALNVDIQGKPITMSSIVGAQAQANAVLDARIFTLTAQANALQGNIQLAEQNAQKAVDLQYAPILEELKIKQAQLELIAPQLSKEEAARAAALKQQYDEQQKQIAETKSTQKELSQFTLDSMSKYPNAGIKLGDSPEVISSKISSTPQYKASIDKFNATGGVAGITGQPKAISTGNEQADILKEKLDLIDTLINHPGLDSRVGPNAVSRTLWAFSDSFGAGQDFASGVAQLVSKETIDTLTALKARGGTLGALSDQERLLLQNAATKIGNWQVWQDKSGKQVPQGTAGAVPIGEYNIDEESFKKELETIKRLTKVAVTRALGYDPTIVPSADTQSVLDIYTSNSSSTGVFDPSIYY